MFIVTIGSQKEEQEVVRRILSYIVFQIEMIQQLSFIVQKKLEILCNPIKLLLNTHSKLCTQQF